MFLTYLLIAAVVGGAIIAVSFTVSFFMSLNDMRDSIKNHDTNGATKATVESVIGSSLQKAKTVNVGLFESGNRVGNVTIECPQGTSVKVNDYVYI